VSAAVLDGRIASEMTAAGGGPRAVLVVDAAQPTGADLTAQLRADGYHAVHARSVQHARMLARGHRVRAVLLGQLDPSSTALDLLEEIRDPVARDEHASVGSWDSDLPVIVLSPHGEQLDMLRAFEAGADDFMRHPPSYLELRARLRAVLRRVERVESPRLLRIGELELDTRARTASVAAARVRLSPLEYAMLAHLARRPTAVIPKRELLLAIWGRGSRVDPRTVDRHASSLRRKLAAAGAAGMVVTVWGVGYRLT
jgi:DNA-binding response OmpR family regulator